MSQAGIVNIADIPIVATTYTGNTGSAVPAGGILNVVGGAGVNVAGSGNTLTITDTGAGFSWNVVNSGSNPITLVAENGYISQGATQVVFVLPTVATVGSTYQIVGYQSSAGVGNYWTITQNAGQFISFGPLKTTTGVGGSLTATTTYRSSITLLCVAANAEFEVINGVGIPNLI
jgi:hypothetical protein